LTASLIRVSSDWLWANAAAGLSSKVPRKPRLEYLSDFNCASYTQRVITERVRKFCESVAVRVIKADSLGLTF